MQTRDISLELADIKFANGKARSFAGYASVFGGVDSYGDTIVRGAYKDSLTRRPRPMMFYGHNPGRVIGKWTAAKEDDHGLFVEGELTPGHSDAEDVYASLKHGAISGLSIGFYPVKSEDTEGGRVLKEIDLIEVSVVSMPADDAARIDTESVKAALSTINSIRDLEMFLRDAGMLSKSVAAAVVSRFKAITQGDPAELAEMKKQRDAALSRAIAAETELLFARHPIPTSL